MTLTLQRSPFGGYSGSKGLAIGAGAGFIGGAVAGVAAVSMYHQVSVLLNWFQLVTDWETELATAFT